MTDKQLSGRRPELPSDSLDRLQEQLSTTAQTPFLCTHGLWGRETAANQDTLPKVRMCSNQPWLLSQPALAPFFPTHRPWDTMTKYLHTRCAVPPSPACLPAHGKSLSLGRKATPGAACWYHSTAPTQLPGGGWSQARHVQTQTCSLHPRTCRHTPRACPDEPVPPAVPRRGNICTLHGLQCRRQNSSIAS